MVYRINGEEIPLQPTTGRWMPKNVTDIDGRGHPIYPGVREFEMRWGLIDVSGSAKLQEFFNSVISTGTAVEPINPLLTLSNRITAGSKVTL